jgi:hypothetical protein
MVLLALMSLGGTVAVFVRYQARTPAGPIL